MPTAWSAGEHDVKVVINGEDRKLECKCGWVHIMTFEELWASGEPWRRIAKEHIGQP